MQIGRLKKTEYCKHVKNLTYWKVSSNETGQNQVDFRLPSTFIDSPAWSVWLFEIRAISSMAQRRVWLSMCLLSRMRDMDKGSSRIRNRSRNPRYEITRIGEELRKPCVFLCSMQWRKIRPINTRSILRVDRRYDPNRFAWECHWVNFWFPKAHSAIGSECSSNDRMETTEAGIWATCRDGAWTTESIEPTSKRYTRLEQTTPQR